MATRTTDSYITIQQSRAAWRKSAAKTAAWRFALGVIALPLFAWGCGGTTAGTSTSSGTSGSSSSSSSGSSSGSSGTGGGGAVDAVARGKYLVDNLLVCGECHTPAGADGKPDMTKYLAGSRSYDFKTQDGKIVSVYAENLTSDNDQGIGTWTDDQVRGAIVTGVDDQNVALWPIMPYPEYSLMKPSDLAAIIAYLRTVKGSSNTVPPDTMQDPDPSTSPVSDSAIPHTTLAASDPAYASAERGRYLASIACVQCHSPAIKPGIPDFTKAFAGGRTYTSRSDVAPSTSTNLTPDATGLAGWSVADIVDSIKTNTEKGTKRALCSTMPGGPHRMGDLAETDLTDLATYLHNLAPIKNGPFKCDMGGGGAGGGGTGGGSSSH